MPRRIVAIVGLAFVAALVILWGILAGRGGTEVDAVRVTRGPLEVTLPVTGILETRAAELAFELPGRLVDVRVREGDAVRTDQILAALDSAELQAAADQAAAGADAARSEAARAAAAVDAARQQAAQAEAAQGVALANLKQVQAGARIEELRQAEAAVEAADSARNQAQRTLQVNEQLAQQGAVAQSQVDASRAQYEAAQAQYLQAVAQYDAVRAGARPEAVEAAVQQTRQAEAAAAAARTNIRQAEAVASTARANARQAEAAARAAQARGRRVFLTAPFDGVVSRVYLNPGSPVAPSIPVVSLVSQGGWITAEVDEADVDVVRVGQRARVTADAYPDVVLAGRVTRIGGAVEFRGGNRAVRVRIDLDSPSAMRSGTSVDVGIVLSMLPGAVLVPLDAVQPGEDGVHYAFVIEQGVLHRRQIELGERNEVSAEAVAGLREGEYVAIGDSGALREGMRVRVRSTR
ncbi:MAG TPA: efflux RND transporter periplasmic adaptor subunit [bacterium]|nr:efflux RND transporter periplasmic adaptor subunit [bacterium]